MHDFESVKQEKSSVRRFYTYLMRFVLFSTLIILVFGYFVWRERTVLIRKWRAASMEVGFHWKYEESEWDSEESLAASRFGFQYARDSDVTFLRLEAPFSDDDIAQLSRCTRLETLYLYSEDFTGASLSTLADLELPIKKLIFRGGSVTDAQFAELEKLKDLECLVFRCQKFDGQSIRHLSRCKKLKVFALENRIDVDHLPILLTIPSLEQIIVRTKGHYEDPDRDERRAKIKAFWESAPHLKEVNPYDIDAGSIDVGRNWRVQ